MIDGNFFRLRKVCVAYFSARGFGVADSEDMAQEVFVKLIKFCCVEEEFDLQNISRGYIYSCCHSVWVNHLRKVSKDACFREYVAGDHEVEDCVGNPINSLIAEELMLRLVRCLGSMSKCRQDVFYYNKFHRFTQAMLAERLNISVKSVERHMSKAMRSVRLVLG